jgi:hypothetical protein
MVVEPFELPYVLPEKLLEESDFRGKADFDWMLKSNSSMI